MRDADRRPAARHRRRPDVADPEIAAGRRGDRLDPAGPVADRRDPGDRPVPQDGRAGARHHREHGGLCLPALRRRLSDPFGSGGAEAAAAEMGVPFLGRLPLSPAIREASDAGKPPAAGDGAGGRSLRATRAPSCSRRWRQSPPEALSRRRHAMPLTRDEDIAELLTERPHHRHGRRVGPARPAVLRRDGIPPGPRLPGAPGQSADHRRACPRRICLARACPDRRADRHGRHLPPAARRRRGGRPGDRGRRQGGLDAARRDQRGSRRARRGGRAQGRHEPLPEDRDHAAELAKIGAAAD